MCSGSSSSVKYVRTKVAATVSVLFTIEFNVLQMNVTSLVPIRTVRFCLVSALTKLAINNGNARTAKITLVGREEKKKATVRNIVPKQRRVSILSNFYKSFHRFTKIPFLAVTSIRRAIEYSRDFYVCKKKGKKVRIAKRYFDV